MSQHHANLPWTESTFFEVELKKANLSDADKALVKGLLKMVMLSSILK